MNREGKYWYELLSEQEKLLFLESFKTNDNLSINEFMGLKFSSFFEFMSGAFIWSHTPEGHDYWMNITMNKKISNMGLKYNIRNVVMV